MDSTQELEAWHRPEWHPDHGDPEIEMGHLRSFALKLLSAVPSATLTLETPEPGLLDVRVELASGTVAEVYSVPSPKDASHRRFAIFLCPDTAAESEIYAEAAEDASEPVRPAVVHVAKRGSTVAGARGSGRVDLGGQPPRSTRPGIRSASGKSGGIRGCASRQAVSRQRVAVGISATAQLKRT